MNYETITLSKKEKLIFISKGLIISIAISYLFYGNLWVGVIIALLYSFTLNNYKKQLMDNRKEELLISFRDMLYSISSSISTGRNMTQALKDSISFWETTYKEDDYLMIELNYMAKCIESSNMNDVEVLSDFAKRTGLNDINNFVLTYKNAKETGCDLINAINHASEVISEKITIEKDIKSGLVEKQFESKFVTLAPFVIMLFLRLTSSDYLGVFLTTVKGNVISTIALALIAISRIIAERIVKIEI